MVEVRPCLGKLRKSAPGRCYPQRNLQQQHLWAVEELARSALCFQKTVQQQQFRAHASHFFSFKLLRASQLRTSLIITCLKGGFNFCWGVFEMCAWAMAAASRRHTS
eukprot:1134860-Pelagomonas_calceolata.AAC.2